MSPAAVPPMPQVIYPDGSASHAMARRDARGTFVLQAEVNGSALPMLFDTGASFVCLRAEDAERVGIDVDALSYSGRVSTAHGQTEVAPVMIRVLTVGGITRHNVPAIVSKRGELADNLLGQSFMSRLAGYKLQGDRLILQGD